MQYFVRFGYFVYTFSQKNATIQLLLYNSVKI